MDPILCEDQIYTSKIFAFFNSLTPLPVLLSAIEQYLNTKKQPGGIFDDSKLPLSPNDDEEEPMTNLIMFKSKPRLLHSSHRILQKTTCTIKIKIEILDR